MFISEHSGKGYGVELAEAQRVADLLQVQALIAREAALSVVTPAVEGVLITIDATAGQIGRGLAKNRLTRSLMLFLFGWGVVDACMAANPQETGSFDPKILTQPVAVVETAIPATKVPTPEIEVDRATVSPKEYAGEQLKEKLKEYNRVPLSSYNEKGETVIWSEKPTGRAVFDIKQDGFTLAFGVNNESWLAIKDGERNVAMDYGNLVDPKTGRPIDNMFAYSLYLDPDTKQITDKITDKSLKVPVISVIKGVNGQPDKWIYLDWHDPILNAEDFYDIVAGNEKGDGLMALVAPDSLVDIIAAPGFVKKIKFEGDWQVLFDEEGGLVMIDVATKEELGSFDGKNWLEAESPAQKQLDADLKNFITVMETYALGETDGKTVVLNDKESGEVKFSFTVGEDGSLTDPVTGEVVYKNGRWDLSYARTLIKASGNCKVTDWIGNNGEVSGPANPKRDGKSFLDRYVKPLREYFETLVKLHKLPNYGISSRQHEYLGGGCWGLVPTNGKTDQTESVMLWEDKVGRPKYLDIFMSSIEE